MDISFNLDEFLSKFEKRNPTENMMIWMKYYDKTCDRFCCHSTHCGSIRCSGCLKYLSGIPPSTRFQCIECEILPPDTLFDNRPEVCESCFSNESLLHNHSKWLKIDSKGIHSLSNRTKGICDLKNLVISDFPVLNLNLLPNKDAECTICYCGFDGDSLPSSYPGCSKNHGAPSLINKLNNEPVDSKKYFHAECMLNWYNLSKKNTYCGNLNLLYCEICRFEKDKEKWIFQFTEVKEYITSLKSKLKNKDEQIKILDFIKEKLSIEISYNENLFETEEKENNLNTNQNKLFEVLAEKLINLHPQE